VRRAALLAVASLAAILIQLTVLNTLSLPGGAAPDLVLILVVAIALTGGPTEGMLTGFLAGLALDIAPPASHLVGQSALVFCLAGYAAGRLSGDLGRASWLPLGALALCAAGGEALFAVVGMVFGDPGVSWPAVRQVLPVSVGYDLLVCPFVLYAVLAVRGWASGGALAYGGGRPGPAAASAGVGGAVRDTGTGRSPRLRAAASRHGDGWIGGAGRAAAQAFPARPLHLRLRGGQPGSARGDAVTRTFAARPVHMRFTRGRGGSASSSPAARARPVRPVHLRLGGKGRPGKGLGGKGLGGKGLAGKGLGGRGLGHSVFGGSVFGGRGMGGRVAGRGALRGRAPGRRAPRGSALRRSGPGGSSLSRGGPALGSGFRSGSGQIAKPRFRGQPSRRMALRSKAPRGLGGRGRARFGRRSKAWRIGSRRTGGLS
jgi:rod shape-determining protein MreD